MNLSNFFIRVSFAVVSMLFFGAFATTFTPESSGLSFVFGALGGLLFAIALFTLTKTLKETSIRSLNITTLGLLFGSLLGLAVLHVLQPFQGLFPSELFTLISAGVYLTTCYIGLVLTAASSEELNFCIPFIKFNPSKAKKKDILLDPSLLSDPRLIDLARSGLLDHQLLMPGFALEDLRTQAESYEENQKARAQSSLDAFKKLEAIPDLELRIITYDCPEAKDPSIKLIRLARRLKANILTGDIRKIQQSELEELKVININLLSQALKPLAAAGEYIQIKIQRFGKEPRQGVGYLDDGTMVVVNGGAEYIGKTIKVVVLSIKPTSSGRMIFCNTLDLDEQICETVPPDLESSHNPYI